MKAKPKTKRAKPLDAARAKIMRAIRAVKQHGIEVAHAWGDIKPYSDGTGEYRFLTAEEYQGETCPMGAVILYYDDVEGTLSYEGAAGKILKTSPNNIIAFVHGFDVESDGPSVGNCATLSERRWFRLGVSMQRYADRP